MVAVSPVPVVVTVPGNLVKVHVPVDGNPPNTTLPDEMVHVGSVIAPITGGEGVTGCAFITTLDDGADMHPVELLTVYV